MSTFGVRMGVRLGVSCGWKVVDLEKRSTSVSKYFLRHKEKAGVPLSSLVSTCILARL